MAYIYIIIYYLSYFIFLFILFIGYLFFSEKKIKEKLAAIAIIVISLIFVYARFVEPKILVKRTTDLTSVIERNLGIKVVVFSDLHAGIYKNSVSLERIVKETNAQNPDIVFIPGDFIYCISKKNIERELAPIAEINSPVYAVLGNHDEAKKKNLSLEIETALKKYGAHIINNKMEKINIRGSDIIIAGLRDLWGSDIDFQLLDKLPDDIYSIVLAHNPDSVYYFPTNCNVNLVVSGHTHGGQIRLPFIYKYIIPSAYGFNEGFYKADGINVYVSSGIGLTGMPLRFLIPPQIDILNI